MRTMKRKSRGTDFVEDVRLKRRLRRRRSKASSSHQIHYGPDEDYMNFLNGLGLGLPPSAADSADRFDANGASDSEEAATFDVGSGVKEDWSMDMDIDLFKYLVGCSMRAEDNGVGNNGDPGATGGCGNEGARYVDGACCSSDENGCSSKGDSGDETSDDCYDDKSVDSIDTDSEFAEETGDIEGSADNGDGGDDNAVDRSFDDDAAAAEEATTGHCNKEAVDIEGSADYGGDDDNAVDMSFEHDAAAAVEVPDHCNKEASDIEGSANNGGDDNAVDRSFDDNAAAAEEVPDHCSNVHSDQDQTAGNDVFEADDPEYVRFLENMRVDGNAYSVAIPMSSGESVFVVYEKEDVSRGQSDAGETRETSLQRKNMEPEICPGQGCNETEDRCQIREGDTGCDLSALNGSNKKSSLMGRKFFYKTKSGVSSGFRREERSQMEDLLESERKKKGGERCEPKVASDRERRNGPESACRTEAPMPERVHPKAGDTIAKKVQASSLVRDRTTETMPCPSEPISKAQKDVSNIQDRKRRRLIYEETQVKETSNRAPCEEEPAATKTPTNKNQQCRPQVEQDRHDKCYETFIRSLQKKPMHVEFVPSVGEKMLYHDSPTSPSDSDVVEIDSATFANDVNTPFESAKNHEVIDLDLEPEEGHAGNHYHSMFRAKLLEILRKPYDHKEYEELLKEVSCRRQLEKDRELRHGRTVTIKLRGFGRSYLDSNTDFARKLKEFKPDSECNPAVRLNLLRGFVYWLENVPLPGSFKPWLDEPCLKVLPSCKRVPWNEQQSEIPFNRGGDETGQYLG